MFSFKSVENQWIYKDILWNSKQDNISFYLYVDHGSLPNRGITRPEIKACFANLWLPFIRWTGVGSVSVLKCPRINRHYKLNQYCTGRSSYRLFSSSPRSRRTHPNKLKGRRDFGSVLTLLSHVSIPWVDKATKRCNPHVST